MILFIYCVSVIQYCSICEGFILKICRIRNYHLVCCAGIHQYWCESQCNSAHGCDFAIRKLLRKFDFIALYGGRNCALHFSSPRSSSTKSFRGTASRTKSGIIKTIIMMVFILWNIFVLYHAIEIISVLICFLPTNRVYWTRSNCIIYFKS